MNKPTQTQIDRVRDLVAMLRGIPSDRFNLNLFSSTGKPANPHACGTLACAAGYAAVYPKFVQQSMYALKDGQPSFKDEKRIAPHAALAFFFGPDSWEIFGVMGSSKYDARHIKTLELGARDLAIYRALRWLNDQVHQCSLEIDAVVP